MIIILIAATKSVESVLPRNEKVHLVDVYQVTAAVIAHKYKVSQHCIFSLRAIMLTTKATRAPVCPHLNIFSSTGAPMQI